MKTITLAKRPKKALNRAKPKNVKSLKEMDVLDHHEKIYDITHECGINSNKLINQIVNSGKCSPIKILKYVNEFEELEKKKLIRCSRSSGGVSYRIPYEAKNSLRKYNEYIPSKNTGLNIDRFFTVLEQLFEERRDNELVFETLTEELMDLINKNMQLEFCKKIMSYKLSHDDLTLLICFCHLAGNNGDDNIGYHDFEFLYENKLMFREIKRVLSDGSHILIDTKFIEFNNNRGFFNNESWKLSDMAKKELLSELDVKVNQSYKKNLILFDTINGKKMFYNSRETKEIETLRSLLSEENYRKIQNRLEGKGMRKGFACLFSGTPGTGKTETVYQIARETKLNIMLVDISQIKSFWYGESEKKIKEIFDTYQHAADNSTIAPILLFNEADAVISKRKEFCSGSRAVDQTENTIQNIILSEMENLSGILIATTNLTSNMDSAFERRFLYKVTFDRPGIESRKGIWNALLSDLPEEKLAELSNKFDLSGGQIENIVRKIEVDAILNGNNIAMDALLKHCKDEVQNTFNVSKSIGFTYA